MRRGSGLVQCGSAERQERYRLPLPMAEGAARVHGWQRLLFQIQVRLCSGALDREGNGQNRALSMRRTRLPPCIRDRALAYCDVPRGAPLIASTGLIEQEQSGIVFAAEKSRCKKTYSCYEVRGIGLFK